MDSESLRTASTYLNNLLLARGLLRNGAPIDFVKPSKESRAQIINLVHDLILKEDRDREQREQVSVTLRTLHTEDARKNAEIERLGVKNEENVRAKVAAQAGERLAREQCKTLERQVKSLQEQAQRLKLQLTQVRTQCANDVRKRDLELQRLKGHLQGQQRGNKAAVVAPGISITGRRPVQNRQIDSTVRGLDDPEYTLKQETTEFLTQLGQTLSDENDQLISLIRHGLTTTRELLGLPAQIRRQHHPDSAIGSANSSAAKLSNAGDSQPVQALPTSYETLAVDMGATLAHLKDVLTNPNFVPLSEVEEREEEIAHLREGWEKMESRWRDVLLMMQGWQKRIHTGEVINLEDLKLGLGLISPRQKSSRGVEAPEDHLAVEQQDSDVNRTSASLSSSVQADADMGASDLHLPPTTTTSPPTKTANNSSSINKRKRNAFEPPEYFDLRPAGPRAFDPKSPSRTSSKSPVRFCNEVVEYSDINPPSTCDAPDESDADALTVQEKLAAAQEEAEAAIRRRATRSQHETLLQGPNSLRAAAGGEGNESSSGKHVAESIDEQHDDTLGKLPSASPMAKRTKIRGRPKRRSTLSREEMAALVTSANKGGDDLDDELF